MSEYKKQHYVPQFYLRHFSKDGVGLCRYSLANETSERRNIKNTCQSFNFHGKGAAGLDVEAAISQVEAKHAPIIEEILDRKNLALISGQDSQNTRFLLDIFVLLTDRRTKLAKEETEVVANALFDSLKSMWAQSDEARKRALTLDDLHKYRLRRDTAGLEGIINALVPPSTISDLSIKLLINETDKPFITSDSPSVFFNFLRLKNLSMRGWQAPGLMIFVPLSDDFMLWLFDQPMYEPHKNITNGDTIFLKRDRDVDELNRLQILNAYEYVIFSNPDDQEYVSTLYMPLKARRQSALIVTKQMETFDVGDERHEIEGIGRTEIDYKPHLSFFKINKAYGEDRKKAYEEHVAKFGYNRLFVRNDELLAIHIAMVRAVKKGGQQAS